MLFVSCHSTHTGRFNLLLPSGCGIFGWPAKVACFEIVRALQEWASTRNAAHNPYPIRVILYDFS